FTIPLRPPSSTLFPYTTLFRSNLHAGLRTVERGDLERAAERRRRHRDRHLAEQVGAVALKQLVRLQRQEDVKIAGGAAAIAGLRSEEHTSELQSRENLVCRLLL